MNKQPDVTNETRRNFIDAFWKLYAEKPINRITINALSSEAGYNRCTFYEYFKDIYDIMSVAEDELLKICSERIRDVLPVNIAEASVKDVAEGVVKLYGAYGERIALLTVVRGDAMFTDKLDRIIYEFIHTSMDITSEASAKYFAAFTSNGIMGIMKQWYRDGRDISEDVIVSILFDILYNGLRGMAGRASE